MNVGYFLSHPQTPYYSFILPSVFVNEDPRALIAKTKSNLSQGRETTLLKALHSCLVSRYRWKSRCLRLKTSTYKPCHIICQLGSTLYNVDGVKTVFLEPTFRLNESRVGRRHKLKSGGKGAFSRVPFAKCLVYSDFRNCCR